MINTIRELQRADGTRLTTNEEIKSEAANHFSEFFNFVPQDYSGISVAALGEIVDFRCNNNQQSALIKEVTTEEIKLTLFKMPKDKSPGPDGFTAEFFKSTWGITGADFSYAIKSFFETGFLPKGINSTILALIRKSSSATYIKDYRPISCCNIMYKVITKILANRMKQILPQFISPNQTAFVKNRALKENVLLASELVKDYHKKSVSPRCSIKIDISKAFDSVQWIFLLNTLTAMQFPAIFIDWIKVCITTASYSVQVNGELSGYFQSKRGLRQGCPLSPHLFVICMDVLSHMLNKAALSRKIGYHPMCKSTKINHLCFADDLMIFSDGKLKSIEGVMTILKEYSHISGLHISVEKSVIYTAGLTEQQVNRILGASNLTIGKLPVRYLGLPLLTKRMQRLDYSVLIEKIRSRINSWRNRFLSYAGRTQLIKSVIGSLVNFWISAFELPKRCIKEVEQICSAFLWSGTSLSSSKSKVRWSDLCKPTAEGGLGFKSIIEANKTSNLNLIWRLLSNKDSLWANWINSRLLKGTSFWNCKLSQHIGSWTWRKIIKLKELAKSFHRVEIHSGTTTSFWFDVWFKECSLYDLLGSRGTIDLGIPITETVGNVLSTYRQRNYRSSVLNDIAAEIQKLASSSQRTSSDTHLWRLTGDTFKPVFNSKSTYEQLREVSPVLRWTNGVWFQFATPKYCFITWLAMLNRLSTGDLMQRWNGARDVHCVFCPHQLETREHLFFECRFSMEIWSATTGKLMMTTYSCQWEHISAYICTRFLTTEKTFLLRYAFQSTLYHIWRERNNRRHGGSPSQAQQLIKNIDKNVRNRLSLLSTTGTNKLKEALQVWFSTR